MRRLPAFLLAVTASALAASLPAGLDWSGSASFHAALQRLSARSGTTLPHQSWPLSTTEIRNFLNLPEVHRNLTASDSLALAAFLGDPRELKRWNRPDDSTFLAIEPEVGGGIRSDSSLNRELATLGGRLYGTLGGRLQYFSQATINTEWADADIYYDRYPEADGEPSGVDFDGCDSLYGKRTFARYTAYAETEYRWFTVKYGRDRIQHGPGEWTGLTTSRALPPWTVLDTRIAPFPWLTVQASVLEARPTETAIGSKNPRYFAGDARKWMHVHRYEVRPCRGLAVAFQNSVIYDADSAGGLQPAYLLPIIPIFFTQDLSGNRDNSAMQFDFRFDRLRPLSLWGAFFIDDLNDPMTIFDDDWRNRWAALAGFRLVSPWRPVDADLTAEISLVRPWTYTGGREADYSFSHYGYATGSENGPDSRSTHVRIAWRPCRRLELAPEFELQEKGTGRGAVLGIVHSGADEDEAPFLAHSRNTEVLTAGMKWEPWDGKILTAAAGYAWSDTSLNRGARWSLSTVISW